MRSPAVWSGVADGEGLAASQAGTESFPPRAREVTGRPRRNGTDGHG